MSNQDEILDAIDKVVMDNDFPEENAIVINPETGKTAVNMDDLTPYNEIPIVEEISNCQVEDTELAEEIEYEQLPDYEGEPEKEDEVEDKNPPAERHNLSLLKTIRLGKNLPKAGITRPDKKVSKKKKNMEKESKKKNIKSANARRNLRKKNARKNKKK